MQKIRVLHVIKSLNLGGAESNLYNLVQVFDQNQFETHIAYSMGGPYESLLKHEGKKLFKFTNRDYRVKDPYSLIIMIKLTWYILRNKIDIVHTHSYSAHVWGSIAAKMAGAKVLEHVHDSRYETKDFLNSRGLEVTRQFDQAHYFAKFSDCIVVLTQANQKYLLDKKITDEKKVRRLLNGIALPSMKWPDRDKIWPKFDVQPKKKIVLLATRLSPEKNTGMVLEVASLVSEKNKNVVFVIAGDGPQRQELKERIQRENLTDYVKLIGYYSCVMELLSASDLFMLPTLRELHSISMIEAMSMKVPVLVSKGAGCNNDFIVHGHDGFLQDPLKPQEWADSILMLVQDSSLCHLVGENARAKIEAQCDIRQTAKNFETIYDELVGKDK